MLFGGPASGCVTLWRLLEGRRCWDLSEILSRLKNFSNTPDSFQTR